VVQLHAFNKPGIRRPGRIPHASADNEDKILPTEQNSQNVKAC